MKAQLYIDGMLFGEYETILSLDEFRIATELALGEALDQMAMQGMHANHRVEVRECGELDAKAGLFNAMRESLTLHVAPSLFEHHRRGKGERKRNKRDRWR